MRKRAEDIPAFEIESADIVCKIVQYLSLRTAALVLRQYFYNLARDSEAESAIVLDRKMNPVHATRYHDVTGVKEVDFHKIGQMPVLIGQLVTFLVAAAKHPLEKRVWYRGEGRRGHHRAFGRRIERGDTAGTSLHLSYKLCHSVSDVIRRPIVEWLCVVRTKYDDHEIER